MGFATLDRMKDALLSVPVSQLERVVLLDMAVAVEDGSLVYTWGHERLARAIGKEPGTTAAKQALSGRILPSLSRKHLIRKAADSYRGRHAEYVLSVLEGPTAARGMGNGLEGEWVTVSEGMGNAQTVTPLPVSLPVSLPGKRTSAEARNRPMSNGQASLLEDLRRMLGYDNAPALRTWGDADDLIREYWPEVERRRHNEEPFDGRTADLSPLGQRYARSRELWFPEDDHGQWATNREETA